MSVVLSPLYPILDSGCLPPGETERERFLADTVHALTAAGVTMLQYRNKHDSDQQVLRDARRLRSAAAASLRILLNDRVHLVVPSGCDGVHVGQGDMPVEQARAFLGPHAMIGLSTHDAAQLEAGDASSADYLAVGPVYATGSKADAEAVIGLDGVQTAREITKRPLVAIGGITLVNAAQVREAGADSLAVISALFGDPTGSPVSDRPAHLQKLAEDFLHIFR